MGTPVKNDASRSQEKTLRLGVLKGVSGTFASLWERGGRGILFSFVKIVFLLVHTSGVFALSLSPWT